MGEGCCAKTIVCQIICSVWWLLYHTLSFIVLKLTWMPGCSQGRLLSRTDDGWVYQCGVTTMAKCFTPPHALSMPKSCQCCQLLPAGIVHCCLKRLHRYVLYKVLVCELVLYLVCCRTSQLRRTDNRRERNCNRAWMWDLRSATELFATLRLTSPLARSRVYYLSRPLMTHASCAMDGSGLSGSWLAWCTGWTQCHPSHCTCASSRCGS